MGAQAPLIPWFVSGGVIGSDGAPVAVFKADGGIDLGSESAIDGGIYLNGGVDGLLTMSTSGGAVRFNGAVELQSEVWINSADDGEPLGAEIRFTVNSPLDSQAGEANNLTLTAGSDGTVSFNADLGAVEALGRLIVTEAAGVAFGNDPSEDDLAPIYTVRVDGDPLAPDAFAIDLGSVSAIGEGGIVLNAGDGETVSFVTTADRVRFNGPVILESHALIDTTDAGAEAGAEIRFTRNATIDGQIAESNNLTLTAGTDGTVGFFADLGANTALGRLIVTDAAGVAFGGVSWEDEAPITTVRVDGDPFDPDAFAINLGSLTSIGDDGIAFNGGNTLSGDPLTLTIASTSDAMRFNGAVELQSDVAIDTTDGNAAEAGAEIRFTLHSPIDSQAGKTNDLTLTAGSDGMVSFNADLGAGEAVGRLVVTAAGGVWLGNDADPGDPDLHPVLLINLAGDGDAATYDLDLGSASQGTADAAIGAGGIVLNGGSTIQLTTSGGAMRLNGAVTLASDAALDTTARGASGADILFTVNGAIDSQAGEYNDLVLTAGSDGWVSFNANLGDTRPIDALTVVQADAGILFGGDDDAGDVDDLGPVTGVSTNGSIDFGAGTNTVDGGILFNGGFATLIMTTTADDVRLNGPVTLGSALAIDIQSGDNRIEFTRVATIDSQTGEQNDLTLNAGVSDGSDVGIGGVLFYGNVGTASAGDQRLGNVTVETSGQILLDPAEANGLVQIAGDLALNARGNIQVVAHEVADDACQVAAASITVNSGEVFIVDDGAVLKSDTGAVSNAGPRLTLDPQDPNDAITPGNPTQTVSGTIGIDASGNYSADNLEQGQNFTLIIVWSDTDANGNQIVTVIRGLSAGQHLTGVVVDANGNVIYSGNDATIAADGSLVFQASSGSGPITFQVTRVYSLVYLMTVTGDVRAIVILGNDGYTTQITGQIGDVAEVKNAPVTPGNIVLDDSRTALDGSDLDLNRTLDVRYKHLAGDQFRFAESPTAVAELKAPRIAMVSRVILEQAAIPEAANRVEYAELRGEESVEEARILYIVKVGPNGEEGEPHRLPDDALADLAGLFAKFKQEGLPNGLYRIYLKEAGFPRRKLIEFYKSGKSIGDPVREPGPGANPLREEAPAATPTDRPRGDASQGPVTPVPATKPAASPSEDDSADAWRPPHHLAHPVVGAAVLALTGLSASGAPGRWSGLVEKAMKESGEESFRYGARLRRRLRRPR